MTKSLVSITQTNQSECAAGSIPVAIISLSDASERRAKLIDRGMPSDWVHAYWPACDLRQATCDELERMIDRRALQDRYGRTLLKGEVGCAQSHLSIYQALVNSDAEMAVIFEDDAIAQNTQLADRILEIARVLSEVTQPNTAFLCHLGPMRRQVRWCPSRRLITFRSPPSIRPILHRLTHRCWLWRAHAYIISRTAAARLLGLQSGGLCHVIDDFPAFQRAGLFDEVFYQWPPLFTQDEEVESTISIQAERQIALHDLASPLPPRGLKTTLGIARWLLRSAPYIERVRH